MSQANFQHLRDAIRNGLANAEPPREYRNALDALRATAEAIENAGVVPAARVTVEPGFQTNLGQGFNVVLSLPEKSFRDVLFRAYLPPTGFPVHLDLFGEDLTTCRDADELEQAIVRFINEHVRMRLSMLTG